MFRMVSGLFGGLCYGLVAHLLVCLLSCVYVHMCMSVRALVADCFCTLVGVSENRGP